MVESKKKQSSGTDKINPWIIRVIGVVICIMIAIFFFKHAFAQSADWINPAVDVIDSVQLGIRLVGGVLIGIAVLIIAIMGFTTGNINWKYVISLVIGGLLMSFGDQAMTTLLGL